MIIKNHNITLRPIRESDTSLLYSLLNDVDIINSVVGFSLPINEEDHKKWINNQLMNPNNGRFIIDYNDYPVGYIALTNMNPYNRSAELGIKIFDKKFHGKGIGSLSVLEIVKYGFNYLNLNRIETTILESNSKSLSLFVNKLGWNIEGKKIASVYRNGAFHNEIMVAILKK
jgi:RimJ/RimL family protein N-acetyltransferase